MHVKLSNKTIYLTLRLNYGVLRVAPFPKNNRFKIFHVILLPKVFILRSCV